MSQLSDRLHSAPFIRLLVPFIAGVILGDLCRPEQKWLFLILSLFFTSLLPFLVTVSFKKETLFGIFLYPALLFLGLFIATDLRYVPKSLPRGEYFAVTDEYPLEKEKSYRTVIRLIPSKIKVLAYFEKGDSVATAEPGSVVWFRGEPQLLQKTGNPFEFDYQTYAIRNQIGHRIYLKNGNYHFLQVQKIPNLVEFSLIIRDRLLRIIEKSGLKGEVFHLVSAVSLGAREELEPETTQSFSKTGVIHVLAVSGMNVAIIYVVLDWLLRFLKRRKWGIVLHLLVILAAVWGYALVTGSSASVLRAAAMFTFIVIGKSLSRNPNIYNTLAASAFVLICFNPSLVYDVGFQLSYAAVFSIVYFHPFLYGLIYCKYWILDQIWTLISVSVAAQIGTLPFLLHYFHQFPTWFLLANLMVIPLVSVILYLSFIVFAVAPIFPFMGMLITRILDWAGQGMLFSVRFVEKLPHSIIEGLYPSDFTLLMVVLFAILISIFIVYRRNKALLGALVLICVLLLVSNINIAKRLLQREVIVFNLPGRSLIALTDGRETLWLTTDTSSTAKKLTYYTKPYEGYRRIKKSSLISISDSSIQNTNKFSRQQNFLNFEGLSLCVLNDRKDEVIDWKSFPKTDLLIISGRSKPDMVKVCEYLPEAMIIGNRTQSGGNEFNDESLVLPEKPKILNTANGGAVQIKFQPSPNGAVRILSCGYFNR